MGPWMRRYRLTGLMAAMVMTAASVASAAEFIVLQSTTSTQNSGLYDHLLPLFEDETGIAVRVVAVGTGQALRNAAEGNGDAVMVHAKGAEDRFVADLADWVDELELVDQVEDDLFDDEESTASAEEDLEDDDFGFGEDPFGEDED